jgi:hypothetical protein
MVAGGRRRRKDPRLSKVVSWLERRGFNVKAGSLWAKPFNDGVWLDGDLVVYDPNVAHPGDLLHEAGHLAILPSCIRTHVKPGDLEKFTLPQITKYMQDHPDAMAHPEDPVALACMNAGDLEAIAWSYAAAVDAKVDPGLVCENGFSDDESGPTTLMLLKNKGYFGVSGLRMAGFVNWTRDFPKLKFWRQP